MTEATVTITGKEAEAHLMWDKIRKIEAKETNNWSTTELLIADALKADYGSARTADEWLELGCVLNSVKIDSFKDQDRCKRRAFRNLTKAGFIRSRRWYQQSHMRGFPGKTVTIYEINFAD